MVRIEKILYEKAINNKLFSRARELTTPQKWFPANPLEHNRLKVKEVFQNTLLGRILKPFVHWWTKKEIKYQLDLFLQQGLTCEDRLLHSDKDLRRNVLHEHMFRESFHPYHWILKARRRERYFKVDFGVSGFFVPDYLRNEAATQTYVDYQKLEREWWTFTYNNYHSDITPQARRSVVPKIIPLELLQNFGILRNDAWDRYFMNEEHTVWYSEKERAVSRDRRVFPFDLTTKDGKRKFEEYVTDYNESVPGALCPAGQKFDFNAYYAEVGV